MRFFNRLTIRLKVGILLIALLLPVTGCITPQISNVSGHVDIGAPQLYPEAAYMVARPISLPVE